MIFVIIYGIELKESRQQTLTINHDETVDLMPK